MNIKPTITFYLNMPDKNSSSLSQIRDAVPSKNTCLIVCQLRSAQIHVGLGLQLDNTTDPHLCRRVQLSCGQLYGGIYVIEKTPQYTPANTRHSTNAVSMLVRRLRHWPSIKTASGECLVLLGRVVLARCALPPV